MKNFINIIRNFFTGIYNILCYAPVIYQDRNCDEYYFFKLIRFKLIRMRNFFKTVNICVEDENSVEEINEVINLLDKFILDDYFHEEYDEILKKYGHLCDIIGKNEEVTNIFSEYFKKCDLQKAADKKLIFDLLNKNSEKWWN